MHPTDDQPPPTRETRTTIQTLLEPDYVHVLLKPGVEVSLEDAVENSAATLELAGPRKIRVLVDTRPARGIEREARTHFSDPEVRKYTVAQALLIDSGPSRVMGNFFLGLNKPPFPTKLFTSEEKAEAWLRGFPT
jgi:hypothetical protein